MCRFAWILLIGLALSACGGGAGRGALATPARSTPVPEGAAASPADSFSVSVKQPSFFIVDQLVRSPQIDGIDLHVRYVERTADDLIVHLSFYNNRGEDLAYVSGIDLDAARLIGGQTYRVTAHSPAFEHGIAPENGWLSGGGTVGWLSFTGVRGNTFTLECPGFPPVQFTLAQPIAAAPEPPPPSEGDYAYDIEVTSSSSQLENITLRVERAEIDADALRLTIAFVNRNPTDITFTSALTGADSVLIDGLWQQYWPAQVDPALRQGIAPQSNVWGEDEANQGTLTFPRPRFGDVMLYQFPGFPPVRLPLHADAQASIAAEADLPPSAGPRPRLAATPTAEPLSADALAREEAERLLKSLSEALDAGDRDAYLRAWGSELQAAQAEFFDQATKLPLEAITLAPRHGEQNGVLTDGGTTLRDYEAILSYRVRGVDPLNVFSTTLKLTLQHHDTGWVITAIDGQMPFWAYTPTEAKRSGAFWIFYPPSIADELPAIEQEAQQALKVVEQALPNRVHPLYVIYITATDEGFSDLTGRSSDRFLGVALARFTFKKSGIEVTNRAMYINGIAFMRDPTQDRQRTIAHELTHLVLAPITMPYTPAWISEGAAMYVTEDFPRSVIEQWYHEHDFDEIKLETLSGQTSFGAHDASEHRTSMNYAYSAYLTRYLIEQYGEAMFIRLYKSFAEVPFESIEPELPDFDDEQALNAALAELAQKLASENVQTVYGIDLPTLERDFETWLEQQLQ